MRPYLSTFLAVLATGFCVFAEEPLPDFSRLQSSPVLRHLKKNSFPGTPKTDAEKTVAQMYVPEGFRVDLVLSEPDLHQPIAFTFDERGRIWVAEAYSYPTKRPAGEGEDKIVIFEDKDGDGKFESRKIFADKLNLVSGFEVGYGGVWIGAAPELLFIPDKNHDDVPDGPAQILLDGFGYQDTHECLNSFIWGPDGWLYGIQGVFNLAYIGKPGAPREQRTELRAGVFRYHPIRHEFEVFAHGGSNPWGLDYDEHGQFFMTHCRSYWGRGNTTHVIQGAQFWNQANANYAPYILADPPRDFPELQNYLLASARHDHGAGGAGARGTDAIYGGHSHVGTMIYYGDNWPEEYRGQLFTHNLGGHQINRDINKRLGSGYETIHAENDMLFCTDPGYVAVDLQYGPDGAVYFIDWSDKQHCHNPNTEKWDRTNGRMYRMVWEKTYKPVKIDLSKLSIAALIKEQEKRNAWYGRTALRLIRERKSKLSESKDIDAMNALSNSTNKEVLMRHYWLSKAFGTGNHMYWDDEDPASAASAVLSELTETNELSYTSMASRLIEFAEATAYPEVRLAFASGLARADDSLAWKLAEILSKKAEDKDDRNIPKLLYQSIAQRMTNGANISRALEIAKNTKMPLVAEWIHWYAASQEGPGLPAAITRISELKGDDQRRSLSALAHALSTRANVKAPETWAKISTDLYANSDVRVVRLTERVAASMGDRSRFSTLRETLQNSSAQSDARKHAFEILSKAQDAESVPTFLKLLDEKEYRTTVIPQLARYDSHDISKILIERFESLPPPDRAAALNVLTARPSYALALLDAVAANKIARDQLSAFHIRQLTQLNDPEIEKRATAVWGRFTKTTDEKKAQIAALQKTFDEAPLWAYSASAGREHFKTLCAQCHKLGEDGVLFGPDLTGSARHGISYFLENIIDPNAVVGTDFQMTNVETKDGELITGLLTAETDSTITIRTQTDKLTITKDKIAKRNLSEKSLMPEGVLEALPPREQLELLKYVTGK